MKGILIFSIALSLLASSACSNTQSWSLSCINSAVAHANFFLTQRNWNPLTMDINAKDQDGMALLHRAVEHDSIAMLEFVLENSGNLNIRNDDEQTALIMAVKLGNWKVFKWLMEFEVDVDAQDLEGKTVLMYAVELGRMEMFGHRIMQKWPDLSAKDSSGSNVLMLTVKLGCMNTFDWIMQNRPDLSATDFSGMTAFMIAVEHKRLEMSSLLIQEDPNLNLNATDNQGRTAILIAVECENYEMFLQLAKLDVDLSLSDDMGRTPLMLLVERGCFEVFVRLVEYEMSVDLNKSARKTPHTLMEMSNVDMLVAPVRGTIDSNVLVSDTIDLNVALSASAALLKLAIKLNRLDVTTRLVNEASLDLKGPTGATLLMIAIEYSHWDIFTVIAKGGAKESIPTDLTEYTWLHWAVKCKHLKVIKLLGELNVDMEATGASRSTPLLFAVQYQYTEVVSLLINLGANVDGKDEHGRTVLWTAVKDCDIKMVDLLVRRGANVNPDGAGTLAPLYVAASQGYLQIATLLVKWGAKIDVTDGAHSPLVAAARNGHLEIVRLFLKRGVKLIVSGSSGKNSPLYAAALNNHADVMRLLINYGAAFDDTDGGLDRFKPMANADSEVGRMLLSWFDGERQMAVLELDDAPSRAAVYGTTEDLEEFLLYNTKYDDVFALAHSFALHLCAYKGYADVFRIFLDNFKRLRPSDAKYWSGMIDCSGMTFLHVAAQQNHIDVTETALKHGSDINALDIHAQTPLFLAAERGHLEMVGYLLSRSAKIDIPAKRGHTPIRIATLMGHYDVIEVLLDHGANVNEVGTYRDCENGAKAGIMKYYSYTIKYPWDRKVSKPVYQVCKKDESKTTEGTDTRTVKDNCFVGLNGESLIHLAVLMGHAEIVELLLRRGARVKGSRMRKTLLHIAAAHGSCDVMTVLHQHGLDVNAIDRQGRTPLHYAVADGEFEAVKLLVAWRARIDVIDKYGMSIFLTAARNWQFAIMEYLVGLGAVGSFPRLSEKKNAIDPMDVVTQTQNKRGRKGASSLGASKRSKR